MIAYLNPLLFFQDNYICISFLPMYVPFPQLLSQISAQFFTFLVCISTVYLNHLLHPMTNLLMPLYLWVLTYLVSLIFSYKIFSIYFLIRKKEKHASPYSHSKIHLFEDVVLQLPALMFLFSFFLF